MRKEKILELIKEFEEAEERIDEEREDIIAGIVEKAVEGDKPAEELVDKLKSIVKTEDEAMTALFFIAYHIGVADYEEVLCETFGGNKNES